MCQRERLFPQRLTLTGSKSLRIRLPRKLLVWVGASLKALQVKTPRADKHRVLQCFKAAKAHYAEHFRNRRRQ